MGWAGQSPSGYLVTMQSKYCRGRQKRGWPHSSRVDVFQFQPPFFASSEAALLADVSFAAPAFSVAAFVAVAEEAPVVLDEASPHFEAIDTLR